jgi:uncharacterized protein YjbJ (UPF0337 family)
MPATWPDRRGRETRHHPSTGTSKMNKDRIEGAAKQIKGSLKEATGKIIGDSKLVADGKADKIEGKIQNTLGGVKDALSQA